jgi:hypothetical protein
LAKNCRQEKAQEKSRVALGVFCLAFLVLYRTQTGLDCSACITIIKHGDKPPVFSTPDSSLNPQALYQKASQAPGTNSLHWVGWIFIESVADYHISVRTEGALSFKIDDLEVIKKRI